MRHVDGIVSDASDLIRTVGNAIDLKFYIRSRTCQGQYRVLNLGHRD